MAHYWGLAAIADRMQVDRATVWRWHRHTPAFLMWRRRKGTRMVWYTNDTLIALWERERCNADAHAPRATPQRNP